MNPNNNIMEMRDPALAASQAEEQTLPTAPATDAAAAPTSAEIETINGIDPEEAAEDEATDGIEQEESDNTTVALTSEVLLETAKALLERDAAEITADDIRRLRQQINALRRNAQESEEKESASEESDELSDIFNSIREKKAAHTAAVEAEQKANYERKQAIVSEITALADDTDNVNRTFPRYRELQDEFNAIGDVPPTFDTALWKSFQEARERYSDSLKVNKELRDYDFKKNLDSKQLLLDEAEGLTTEEDVITAYRRLQELHNKWRRIGPVAKEFREEIWDKFKAASAEINKRYQAHFEARKAREAENEAGKTALCQEMEGIDLDSLRSFNAWEEATKRVMEIQQKWRTYGFASKKMNKTLFAQFRELCDKFFAAKAAYFQSTREELSANLERKTALADRAEALKDSTDWKSAGDEFVEMQKEWKTIGAVSKKYSDAVWNRFQQACDHFFEQKKKATSGARRIENENLKAKREVIASLEAINADTPREEAIAAMRALQDKWKEIGHVPFREKDKLYDAYRNALDKLRDGLNLRRNQERRERFSEAVQAIEGDDNKLMREREKLVRALENRRQELRTYENNLGFLSAKSKSGDSLLREFERKAERLRADIADLEEKIKVVNSKL
ncbi:MAG: DUF349 domain-containing protein [Odoribacter sp.]|nr:DUF349 domain-containing protein [Odoribacter sp.]